MYDLPTVLTRYSKLSFALFSVIALCLFAWPLFTGAQVASSGVALTISLISIPFFALLLLFVAEPTVQSLNVVALVGVLAAVAALARVLSTGFGGFELVFVVVILAGRALGPRPGFVVGVLAIAVSSLVWGGFGPWTAYQMVALGWVGIGAGIIPTTWGRMSTKSHRAETLMLAAYGFVVSYLFGLLMNLWFWPIAVGPDTSLSLDSSQTLAENVSSIFLYSLATSTLSWDTVRALTTVVTLLLVGGPTLRAIRRVYDRELLDREVLGFGMMKDESVS